MVNKRGKIANHNYSQRSYNSKGYTSFDEFYPYYLGEHCQETNRRLHLIGTTISFLLVCGGMLTGTTVLFLVALVQGYGLAWAGHFFFEKNKPATFKHPIYSFMGDMLMWWEVVTGARDF